jgi:hypothetical protein
MIKIYNKRIFFVVLILFISSYATLNATDFVTPRTKLPGKGITVISPDEEGWLFFDPDGKGKHLAKDGATRIETYAINLNYHRSGNFKSEDEFLETIKQILTYTEKRFKLRSANVKLNPKRGPYFVNFHILSEDYEANQMPKDKKFALIEMMGFYARHPDEPSLIIMLQYSYRYYPGHEDPEFKKKAAWVIKNATFTNYKLPNQANSADAKNSAAD